MSATSALLSIAADSPAELTTQGIDRWLATLSAQERADWKWMGPGIKAALAMLFDSPLTRQTLDAATEGFARVLFGRRRAFTRLLHVDVSALTIAGAVEARRSALMSLLGSEVLFSQFDLAARAIDITTEAIRQMFLTTPAVHADLDRLLDADLDELVALMMADPLGSLLRAEVCMVGIFEAVDGHGSAERSRELARLALIASVEAVIAARANDLEIAIDPSHFAASDFDQALEALGRISLSDPNDAHGAAYWVQARMLQPPYPEFPVVQPEPAPARFPRRLRRYVGDVIAVGFGPQPTISLFCVDTAHMFIATPELVERALALRNAPVEAMAVTEPSGFAWWPTSSRLVQIGPATQELPSPASRTRDIVRDWDELLHRLAR